MRVRCWYCQAVRWRMLMTGKQAGWWCRNQAACLRRYERLHESGRH
jgi:hypothetical protein